MADNQLVITASLNIPETVNNIQNELNKQVAPQLHLDIACNLNKAAIGNIQAQLGKIKNNVSVNIDTQLNKDGLDRQVKEIEKALNLEYPRGKTAELRNELKGLVSEYKKAFDAEGGYGEQAEKHMVDIFKFASNYRKEMYLTNEELKNTQERIVEIQKEQQKMLLTVDQYNALSREAEKNFTTVRAMMDNAVGGGRWTADANKYNFDKPYYWSNFAEEVNKINPLKGSIINEGDIVQGVKDLAEFMSKSFSIVDDTLDKNGKHFQDWAQTVLGTVQNVTGRNAFAGEYFDINTDEDVKEVEDLITVIGEYDNAIKTAQKDTANFKYPERLDTASDTDNILANAKKVISEGLAENAETAKDKVSRVKKAVEDAEGTLQSFVVQVEKENKSIETLTYSLNAQGDAYEYVGKTIREADNSTAFRHEDITTQWTRRSEDLKKFITDAEKAGIASTILAEDISTLKTRLADGGDTSAMNKFLDSLNIAKAKLAAYNAEVRKDNAITNFNNKIKKLTADMNAYAATNKRAVESLKKMTDGTTFADEWVRLTTLMAKGTNLTDKELRNLMADIAVFKKEAKAAGLEGASAFERFANSFKVISTYISANQIINRVINQIREAVTELKEIDNILTEISKTSDRTTESLKALGEASFDVASNYGRTASDYLLGVQEMSRAGFGESQSEQLAELSLKAQAAGDMTAEMANEYIIATNAAYALQGSEEKLNQVLDSQNYITNHNAVNMENLAQATKIAASQASASGVAIDELTAAVGTMVAVTQQGGDQAGRAFKGILMNIQQVKASAADIGDDGEDITAESLSKYEKASAALGVALKEVKNGTLQLREPMEVLRDLAEAVSKESEGSIKVANLISAVGGKFRGNQLIALLKNWETYEKMLSEFNSDKAIGSAMDEAEKSANNWAGSINKVKNSWAELTSKFADSDNMVSVLNSINAIIQSITNSSTTGALSMLSDVFAGIAKGVSFLSEKLGALPTLLTTIATISSIRGKGLLFGDKTISSLSGGFKDATASLKGYLAGLDAAKVKTLALKAATVALEAAITLAFSWLISKGIEALSKFANAEEIAIEKQKEFRQNTLENVNAYKNEIEESGELLSSYIDLVSTTSDLSSEKEKLLKIQDQINDSIKDQTKEVDLLNKSLSENIELTTQQRLEEAKKTVSENQAAYEGIIAGEQASYPAMQTFNDKDVTRAISEIELATGKRISGTLKEQSQQLEEILDLYHNIDGYNKQYYNDLVKGKQAIDSQLADWETIKNTVESAQKTVRELTVSPELQNSFNDLIDRAKELYNEINGEGTVDQKFLASEKLKELRSQLYELVDGNSELTQIADAIFTSFDNGVESAVSSVGNLKEAWLATLDDMQKGSLKNISTMVSALQDLSEGKGIAANTFWSLIEFDTEGLLNGAKLVGDKFYITQENMIKLKDQYIQKEIESLKNTQTDVKLQKDKYDELVSQYELEVAILQMRGTNPLSSEMITARNNLEKAKRAAKEFGDEWERNNWLIEYLNQTLGNTVDLEKELQAQQKALNKEITALNKELDDLLKAQEHQIDAIVKGLEIEQTALENQKQDLEDELEVLEKQKDVLEEIVGNYDKVNTLVQNTLQKEIDALEAEKDSIEEAYKKRIDALKEENEQRSDALEYAQKLANLENAKNNKVRVIDETRGFRYESKKEDVVKAEKELKDFENEQQIKQLEKERDAEIKVRDERIKNIEAYAKDWKEMAQEVTDSQTEIIAQELLGSDWREEITNLDIETLETFRTAYATHNADLEKLTNGEIKLKKAAIDAKDAEINAKKKQIDAWKDYKKEVQNAVQTVKNEYSTYMTKLGTVYLTEKSNLEDRESNLTTFTNNVTGLISQITDKQGEVDRITASLDNLEGKSLSVDVSVQGQDLVDKLRDTLREVEDYAKGITIVTAPEVFELMGERGYTHINEVIQHWRNSAPQKITAPTTSTVTRKGAPNVSALQPTTNTSNVTVNIDKIVTDSPADFAKQLDQYCRTKLTANYTRS